MAANEWDQLEDEPPDWFMRFYTYYLPLGSNRSIEQAFRDWRDNEALKSKAKRPNPTWYRSSAQWRWADRAHAWDVAQAKTAIAETADEITDMKKRSIRAAMLFQGVALKRLETLGKNPDLLTPAEALRFYREALEIERQARGLPKEILEVWNLDNDQVVKKYEQLLAGLTAVGGLGSGDEIAGDSDTPPGGDG